MFSVKMTNERFWFSSAHFLSGEGYTEGIHGHNFQVTVEIFGLLDKQKMVVDFLKLSPIVSKIVNRLDHRLIIGELNPNLIIKKTEKEVIIKVKINNKYYVFPRDEVVFLPLTNGTVEELAQFITKQLVKAILQVHENKDQKISSIAVEVSECPWRLGKYRTNVQ